MIKFNFTKAASLLILAFALTFAGCGDDNPTGTNGNGNGNGNGEEGTPSINSFEPAYADFGQEVTITGENFASAADENTVTFADGVEATVESASSTELTVTVPEGAVDGPISVETNGETATSSASFAIVPQLYQDFPGNKTLIYGDETWSNDTTVAGPHFVLPGATLTVEPGVIVEFEYHNNNADDVGTIITIPGDQSNYTNERPSGRLVADGEPDAPIVFTSTRKEVASWGGIILAGEASNNVPGGQGEIEGLSEGVQFGADIDGGQSFKDDDDSGVLSYVQINYSGYSIAAGSELQALTTYSVGSGTQIDHISIFRSVDDGIEPFGGTHDIKYLVVVDAQDDTFDGDLGWTGRGQFWLGLTTPGTPSNRGYENDGCADTGDCDGGNGPTEYKVYNTTVWGNDNANGETIYGTMLREGLTGSYSNTIIANYGNAVVPIYVETDGTEANIGNTLTFGGNFSYNNASNDYSGLPYTQEDVGLTVVDSSPFTDAASFDFSLVEGSAPATAGVSVPSDDFYTQVEFSGAVGVKGSEHDWITGAEWIKWTE
ncbi:IPT/TIG domain-containing protein [Halalkalibaculum sp. DA3122]|uniref:IPT/TIG domain-containing protein n=1 Tax=Halalkalibaculum sp. DA3122 TaxID=3373607 RepID=UPI0037542077